MHMLRRLELIRCQNRFYRNVGAIAECRRANGAEFISQRRFLMQLTVAHIAPLTALVAGILILIIPRLLNYIVAIYLILVGLVGLNAIHHFLR